MTSLTDIFRQFLRDLGLLHDPSVTVRDELAVSAIQELAHKERRNPEDVADELLVLAVQERQERDALLLLWYQLSYREQQVIALAGLGYNNRQIATRLHISVSTVKAYLSNAYYKLGVRNRGELAATFREWDFERWVKEKIGRL